MRIAKSKNAVIGAGIGAGIGAATAALTHLMDKANTGSKSKARFLLS